MNLNEAIIELEEHGYILEDTDTQDDEYSVLHRQYDDAIKDGPAKSDPLKKKKLKLYYQHLDLEDKIEHAQDFNVDNRIENSSGFGTAIKNVYGKTILAELKKKALV